MKLVRTLISSIAGTTCMTLYSYVRARKRKKQFEEPVLLHKLIEKEKWPALGISIKKGSRLDGWLLHYMTGFVFASVYDRIWNRTSVTPSVPAGIAMGAITGLAGVGIWNITLKLHPDPPKVDISAYSQHLMAAHIVFGLFSALGYRLPNLSEKLRSGHRSVEGDDGNIRATEGLQKLPA